MNLTAEQREKAREYFMSNFPLRAQWIKYASEKEIQEWVNMYANDELNKQLGIK